MKLLYKLAIVVIIYTLLAIPDPRNPLPVKESEGYSPTSEWWGTYAQNLVKYRIINSPARAYYYEFHRNYLLQQLDKMELELTDPEDPLLDSINYHLTKLAALASLVPNKINEFEGDILRWRKLLKYQSRYWDISSKTDSNKLYQLIVESRLAFESALVQSDFPSVSWSSEASNKGLPVVTVKNIVFQSGDIVAFNLVDNAETCLTIRRDMPNAYDHLGNVYITEDNAYVIYMDKDTGLQTMPVEGFVNDYAPNGIVLRLRSDLPQMIEKPELPAMVASSLFKMANEGQYKYDYQFDLNTNNFLFDWEMLSNAFKNFDLNLGPEKALQNTHTIRVGSGKSRKEAFELEYDPQFLVVSEWYNTKTLYDKRVLIAATSSIILSNKKVDFVSPFILPVYRIKKGYSMVLNQLGFKGPIPQGITAQTELARRTLRKEQEKAVMELTQELTKYEIEQKHKATYLKMLQAAKEINHNQLAGL